MLPTLPNLNPEERLVLQLIAERDMDGYTLRAKAGLTDDKQLQQAIKLLSQSGLINVKGETYGEGFLKAWYQASPQAAFLLQRLP